MAEIYLVEGDTAGGAGGPLAIKLMLPHLCSDAAQIRMFETEARILSELSHPNLVRGFEFGEEAGRYYFAMEYLAGKDSAALAQRAWRTDPGLSPDAAMHIVAAAATGLHHAHNHGPDGRSWQIVHRDVNPHNIMVTASGAVKVLDFGVAHTAEQAAHGPSTGTVKGKAAYCSPEQLSGSAVDGRSDVFSLGVVLHELLSGQRLFRRSTQAETMLAVVDAPIPPVSELRPGLVPALDDIVGRALMRNPDQRQTSAAGLAEELRGVASPDAEPLAALLQRLFPDAELR